MDGDRTPPVRRATVAEAARILDTSAEAVRSRIKRGTLRSIKEGGTVYVLLRPDQAPPEQGPGAAQTSAQTPPDTLINAKDETIALLREQLAAERRANEENRRIIAALTARIPEIEAPREQEIPQESPGAPTEATEQPGRVGPQSEVEGPQAGAQPRSWWRRVFGG